MKLPDYDFWTKLWTYIGCSTFAFLVLWALVLLAAGMPLDV